MTQQAKSKKKHFHFTLLDAGSGYIPKGNVTYLISFFIPVLIYVIIYYLRDFFPFGESCYLRSDMYHQYAPFFSELWSRLRNGEALTYTFDNGMGTNFLSLIAYYLASPANWIIVLFPQKYMIEIMNILIIIKTAAASTTITYYLSKHFNTKSCVLSLFGFFYATSAYMAAYSWNIMWLDCILLFPLIILGLERLVKENKGLLYCISLGLSIFSNYYISIMICMAVVLYFLVLIISFDGLKKTVIYFKKFISFAFYSLMAGGLAACLLLPEIYTLTLSASGSVTFPKKLSIYFSVLEMAIRHLINVPVHLGLEHYPNIYCGVAVFLLLPLYIACKKVNAKEKIGKCVILLMFLLAYNFNTLNFIWHGFHFPNSLPCRQSFIYIFFLLVMCYEAIHHIRSLTRKDMTHALWFALLFLIFAEQIFAENADYDKEIFYISGAFILIYALLMYIHRFGRFRYPVALFIAFGVVVTECTVNMEATGLSATNRTAYLLDYDAVKNVTSSIESTDDSFYRMDKIYGARSKNDGSWHNYHSISTFSSTCPKGMTDIYKALGMTGSVNAYSYDGSTMLTNSLFSVKYLISNKLLNQSDLFTYVAGSDGEFIYRNNYTLPIGYVVDNSFTYVWQPESVSALENQNEMINAMTGINDVFVLKELFSAATEFTIKPDENAHMYLSFRGSNIEKAEVEVNGNITTHSNLKNNPHTIDLGYVTTDEIIHVTCDTSTNMQLYALNETQFINAYNRLNSNSFNVDSWSDTHFKGTIDTSQSGTFLLSIPYDAGWSIYIDGKKVETFAAQNALLATAIEAGSHTVELKYTPVNMILGCIITAICIIILIASQLILKAIYTGRLKTDKLPVVMQNLLNKEDIVLESIQYIPADADEAADIGIPDENNRLLEQLDELDDFENLELEGRNNS